MARLLQNYFAKIKQQNQKTQVIAYLAALDYLNEVAPFIASSIIKELKDQRTHLKLIASENYSSLAVQLAMGNLLTDKYAEGYPFHRFYSGCENVDSIENQAVEYAKNLFGAHHAYVQPHSGADANLVAYWSILIQKVQNKEIEALGKKNLDELTGEEYESIRKLLSQQKILGLSLSSGGHLTHGYRHNVSSKMMKAISYEVDPQTHLIDYQNVKQIALKEKPLILLAGYSAYTRLIDFSIMREIADEVGAVFMVDMAHFAGLVAGKIFKGKNNPIPYAHIVTTTTHKTLRGPRGGLVLCHSDFADTINKGCPIILGGPLPHVIAAKAIAFKEALDPSFALYAQKIVENAQALAEELNKQGLKVITGGTDNHIVLLDISPLGITGRQAEIVLRKAGITLNRNMVPSDQNGPWYTSGIRLGTAALTSLGMGKIEMQKIGQIISYLLKASKPLKDEKTGAYSKAKADVDNNISEKAKREVEEMLQLFPLYPELFIEE